MYNVISYQILSHAAQMTKKSSLYEERGMESNQTVLNLHELGSVQTVQRAYRFYLEPHASLLS